MHYNLYSRVNQQILDGTIVGISFFLAFLIRYDGAIPAYDEYQFWALVVPFVAARMIVNSLFGLHRIQWRYMGIGDGIRVAQSYVAFSCLLSLIRFGLPEHGGLI